MNEEALPARICKKLKIEHSLIKIHPQKQLHSTSKMQRKMQFDIHKQEKLFMLNTNIYLSPSKVR